MKGLSSERRLLEGVLTDAGYNQADARRLSSSTVEFLADMGDRATLSQTVRQNLAGLDRINAGRLLDRTMSGANAWILGGGRKKWGRGAPLRWRNAFKANNPP